MTLRFYRAILPVTSNHCKKGKLLVRVGHKAKGPREISGQPVANDKRKYILYFFLPILLTRDGFFVLNGLDRGRRCDRILLKKDQEQTRAVPSKEAKEQTRYYFSSYHQLLEG